MTNPHSLILDRETPSQQISQHFSKAVWLLRELVNYGTNLVPRCFQSSDKTPVDVFILGALTKQAITHLDGVEIQISQGAILASHVSARAFFEASLYITWILENDTDRRARQYYVWNLRQNRMWARRIVPGNSEHADFVSALQTTPGLEDLVDLPDIQTKIDEAQNQIANIDEQLSLPVYQPINNEFDRIKGKNYDKPWYAPWGVSSIRQMAKRLNRLAEYEIFYSILSDVTHSSAFRKHVSVDGERVTFEPIRHLESIDTVFRLVVTNALWIYRALLDNYRPGEIENFNRKYREEWRDPFVTIRSVHYSATHQIPP